MTGGKSADAPDDVYFTSLASDEQALTLNLGSMQLKLGVGRCKHNFFAPSFTMIY